MKARMSGHSSPRILEVGEVSRMSHAFPDTTEFFSTFVRGTERNTPPGTKLISAATLCTLFRRLSDSAIDLIVVHAAPHGVLEGIVRTVFRRSTLSGHLPIFRTFSQQLFRRSTKAPVAVLDLQDSPSILPCNRHLLECSTLYFKRELPLDRWRLFTASGKTPTLRYRQVSRYQHSMSRIRPLSLGLSDPVTQAGFSACPSNGKDIDVFFAGRLNHSSTVRERGALELMQMETEGLRIDIGEARMSPAEYLARCARAWLVWAPEGYGWDCFRPYEAALAGSVPLISRQTIERYEPFIDNQHCIYYDVEVGHLALAVRRALQDRGRLLRMAEAARAHMLQHHTPTALAHHVVQSTLNAARQPRP